MTVTGDPLFESFSLSERQVAPPVAHCAVDVLRQLRNTRYGAAKTLERFFRTHHELGATDRAFVADLVHAYVRWRGRLLAALSGAGWRGRGPETAGCALLLSAAGYAAEDVARTLPEGAGGVDLLSAVARLNELDPRGAADTEQLASRASFPEWFISALVRQYGFERARDIAVALRRRAPSVLRTNVLKRTRQEAASRLRADSIECDETVYSPWGLVLPNRDSVVQTAAFRSGLVEPQDEASQLVALLCDASPGMTVIDACAGAGGKALAMAATMKNRGSIVTTDIDARKLVETRKRAGRAGIEILTTVTLGARCFPPQLESSGDVVLVDAPCTGSGTWRRSPDGPDRLRAADVAVLADTQVGILSDAARLVKPGGLLVYATCSLFEAENQNVVRRWQQTTTAFELVAAPDRLPDPARTVSEDNASFVVAPDLSDMDGFFAAAFRRSP